jgi:hypothetical protein
MIKQRTCCFRHIAFSCSRREWEKVAEGRMRALALPAWDHGFEIFIEVLEVFKAHPAFVGFGFHRAV